MPGLFISYRRSDNPDAVGRIYDRLVSEFGKPMVYKDVDSIPLGQDFRGHLNDIVGNCAAVLAIIGPKWTDIRGETGQRRLDDPDDFVRIELEAALARKVPVVPVLVGHAAMPATTQLPPSLASLAFRQAVDVRPDPDFHHDSMRLVSALRAILDPNAPPVEAVAAQPKRSWSPWLAGLAAAATLAAVALAIPAVEHLREVPPPEMRTEIVTSSSPSDSMFALSPDGRMLAYVAKDGDVERLWLRNLSSSTARPLAGTDGASAPFWSPDSQSLGFFANNSLRRIDPGSGQVRVLGASGPASAGTWNAAGDILFVAGPANPLLRISANGGATREVVSLGDVHTAIRFPHFLPDGQRFLFMSLAGTAPGVYLGSLAGEPPVKLTSEAAVPAYLPSGWMLYNPDRGLLAQRLDLGKGALTGDVVSVSDDVGWTSTSMNGLVAYRGTGRAGTRLAFRDRGGNLLGTIGDAGEQYDAPAVSPDGRSVAFVRVSQSRTDVWVLEGSRATRITFDGLGAFPIWSADGRGIVHVSFPSGRFAFQLRSSSGLGEPDTLLDTPQAKFPSSMSPDGRHLLYFVANAETRGDLHLLPMTGERKPAVLLATPYFEVWPKFSPDGRWVAYHSDDSGRGEVYVRPFVDSGDGDAGPRLAAGRWQVSTAGGIFPTWRADGGEIYFLGPSGEMMAASVEVDGATLRPGTPVKLFDTGIVGGGKDTSVGRQYDVAPDGRFLINEMPEAEGFPITLLQNWRPPVK